MLFNPHFLQWLQKKGYEEEARFVSVILNWHRASDERGLTELKRSQYNYELLNFMLEEMIPWSKDKYDFSLMEVNRYVRLNIGPITRVILLPFAFYHRPVDKICGFTREVTIGLLANIESTEWVRVERANSDLPPEHPRASTTDDVECFFSVIRDLVGKDFTLKHVQTEWRKICVEFNKRLSPDLPFYYYTSDHDRFYEGERPDFNKPSHEKSRLEMMRPTRRELTSAFVSGRISLPVRGSISVRPQFHNLPTQLPLPPALETHDYASTS